MKLNIGDYEMTGNNKEKPKGTFINREISWLDFNSRVLDCARKKSNPINERLNFLGITGSNLEEFISVRFANAYHYKNSEPYKEILKKIKDFKKLQNETFKELKKEITKKYNLTFVKPCDLSKKEKLKLKDVFYADIFPLLTAIDIVTNDVNVNNNVTYITAIIKTRNFERVTIIPLIKGLESIYQINNKIILLEDIVLYFMESSLFINQEIVSTGVFRVVKDGSVILSHDESKFIVDRMNDTLNIRTNAKPLFLDLTKNTDERLERLLMSIFKIPSGHIYKKNNIINYRIFSQEKLIEGSHGSYKPFTPFIYENYENYYNIFDAIDNEDILLHHPYDSYDTVIKFIEHAANDPNVTTIRQTLYRVSGMDSPIVNALCKAATNGKFVTALVEIKARFDENNNIRIIEKLKRAGVNVVFGDEYFKTHCKMCVVTRKEKDKIRIYSNVATGNYNEKTARLYTDLSYFTAKQKIGRDLLLIFSIISGHSKPDDDLEKVYYAPVNLRKRLEKCIKREIDHAKKGRKAEIFIKVNSISDVPMVNKLYEAADAGVDVYIICRGVCSLAPRKNLYIKSIVGRFLEHSRIYYFRDNKSHEYYISSADLLSRNLDRRVETLISLKDSNVIKQMEWIRDTLKSDEANSFEMHSDGTWSSKKGNTDCHQWMILNNDDKKSKSSNKKNKGMNK